MGSLIVVMVACCLASFASAANCSLPQNEISALQELYYSLNGNDWHWDSSMGQPWNFTSAVSPCDGWQGITCSVCTLVNNSSHAYITGINISGFNAVGLFTEGLLTNFPYCMSLDLSINSIFGSIPSIAGLSNLVIYSIGYNLFYGTIPDLTFVGNHQLEAILIENNEFSGVVPSSVFSSPQLKYLYLAYNALSGQLSSSIANVTSLQMIYLDDNQFSGTLPEVMSSLISLEYISISSNLFTGTVDVFGNMPKLVYSSVRSNYFVGSLPTNISNCRNLTVLRLDNNYLSHYIPVTLSKLMSLEAITFSSNLFSGTLDSMFQSAGSGEYSYSSLSSINMDNNRFTGTIPMEIFLIPQLRLVSLSQNCFMGSIPETVCEASQLTSLVLDGLTSGKSCRKYLLLGLSTAYVPQNYITGTIPSCILSLPNITVFHISGNGIKTSFSSFATTVSPTLQHLSLSYNQITGTIPHSLQSMDIMYRDFAYNRIGGTIIKMGLYGAFNSSGNYTLQLDVNRLSGPIPNEFHTMRGNIDILSGNLFECTGQSIPLHDPSASSFVCGSHQLNESEFAATSVCGAFIMVLLLAWLHNYWSNQIKHNDQQTIESSDNKTNVSENQNVSKLSETAATRDSTASISSIADMQGQFDSEDDATVTRNSFARGSQFGEFGSLSAYVETVPKNPSRIHLSIDDSGVNRLNSNDHSQGQRTFSKGSMDKAAELYDVLNLVIHERLEDIIFGTTGLKLFTKEILQMPKLFRFVKLLHQFRQIFFILLASCLLLLLPIYCMFSWYPKYGLFTDYSFKYGWATSAAYATGTITAICLIIIWIFMALLSVWRILTIKGLLKVEENLIGIRFKSSDDQVKSERYILYRQKKKMYKENKTWANYLALGHSFKVFALCWIVAIVDIAAMVGLNIGYVFGELSSLPYGIKFILQGTTAAIKLIWNFVILRYFIKKITTYKGDPKDKKVNLYIALVAFNNIAAPVIATMMTDSRCFRSIIISSNPIVSTFNVFSCQSSLFNSNLALFDEFCKDSVDTISFSFAPPFIYSYQCGSAIITDFIPMFTYSYSLMLIWPLLQTLLIQIDHNRIPQWLLYHLPGTLWPMADHRLFKKMMNPDIEIIQQLLHLFLMLTFGVTSIQLAVLICFSAIASSITNQVLVVRFIRMRTVQRKRSVYCAFDPTNPIKRDSMLDEISAVQSKHQSLGNSQDNRESMDSMANDVEMMSEGDRNSALHGAKASVLGLLENACSGSWRRLLNGGVLVFIGAMTFYVVVIYDAAAEQHSELALSGIWVPIVCIVPPTIFYLVRHYYCKSQGWTSNSENRSRILSGRFVNPLGNRYSKRIISPSNNFSEVAIQMNPMAKSSLKLERNEGKIDQTQKGALPVDSFFQRPEYDSDESSGSEPDEFPAELGNQNQQTIN